MTPISAETMSTYWSSDFVAVNMIVFANIFGSLLLGLIVGYERSFHGRAAGMRTYGIVCMASCAITIVAGYPSYWFGGNSLGSFAGNLPPDPTRVIQGIVTGVGFLGAGVIMKDRLNISGLTTAASIWSASGIGILVGVGFYSAAILLSILSSILMMWGAKFEHWLPSRRAFMVTLNFRQGVVPQMNLLSRAARNRGYEILTGSLEIRRSGERIIWRCIVMALSREAGVSIANLSDELGRFEGIEEFHLSQARN